MHVFFPYIFLFNARWQVAYGMELQGNLRARVLLASARFVMWNPLCLQWDIKVQYGRPPLALLGGYEDWLLRYPALCTNPQPAPRAKPARDMLGTKAVANICIRIRICVNSASTYALIPHQHMRNFRIV